MAAPEGVKAPRVDGSEGARGIVPTKLFNLGKTRGAISSVREYLWSYQSFDSRPVSVAAGTGFFVIPQLAPACTPAGLRT
jgi:hypothetical protein